MGEYYNRAPMRRIAPILLKTNIVPEDLRVDLRGDTAVVTFNVHNPSAVSRRTFVWRRGADGWRIVHLHASNK
jgi:hypothetical protein